ncbi:MAG: hypothetical protein AAFU69_04060, partial [Pseudomonadota bacterium]
MMALTDFSHGQKVEQNAQETSHDIHDEVSNDGARRFIAVTAATALLIAACGLWFIPSVDSATQLIKAFVSLSMIAAGMYLLHGISARSIDPQIAVDPVKRELRVYEYDRRGRATMKAKHCLDELQDVKISEHQVTATNAHGVLILDMPIESPETEKALRKALQS